MKESEVQQLGYCDVCGAQQGMDRLADQFDQPPLRTQALLEVSGRPPNILRELGQEFGPELILIRKGRLLHKLVLE